MSKTKVFIIILILISVVAFAYKKYMPDTNQQNSVSENTNDMFPKPIVKDGVTYSLVGKDEITRLYLLDGTEEEEKSGYSVNLIATKSDGSTKWSTQIFWTKISSPEYLKTLITEFVLEENNLKISGAIQTQMIDINTGELQKQ